MNHKELDELTNALKELQDNQDVVKIDKLIDYIETIDDNSKKEDARKTDYILAEYKANIDTNIANANNENAMAMEMFKSVILSGQSAIKFSMVINGGGAISLLAFIGKIWTDSLDSVLLESLAISIFFFSLGILFAAIVSGTTYLSQYSYSLDKNKLGNVINLVSVFLVLSSYLTFMIAIVYSLKSFGFEITSFF